MQRCSGILVHQELRRPIGCQLDRHLPGLFEADQTRMKRFVGMLCWKNDTSTENGIGVMELLSNGAEVSLRIETHQRQMEKRRSYSVLGFLCGSFSTKPRQIL
ncbi:hypothetical protein NE237_003816 [Protea cynaroides]|uniref:Uncharacterized protein n=1 Tax=Protea cynaroides TaxID=273540 RepID=A0A9Q0KHN2_9MAGN|nr:hypothetical protein NE237_003816 [Protea cynaroides]